jgi:hypothetical protein
MIEVVLDCFVQQKSWHELYIFVRNIRNQLTCTHPFAPDNSFVNQQQDKGKNDDDDDNDKTLLVCNGNNHHPAASLTVSLNECDKNTSSSAAASFNMIKNELKRHYYGLTQVEKPDIRSCNLAVRSSYMGEIL